MKINASLFSLGAAASVAFASFMPMSAQAVSYGSVATVNGSYGAEWVGINAVHVTYDAAAPNGNFGSPGTTNTASYDIYIRSDSNYVYGLFQLTPSPGQASAPLFSNLYVSTNPAVGSNLGFELTNNRAFNPDTGTTYSGLDQRGFAYQDSSANGAIEVAIPWSYLTSDPQGVGFQKISATNNTFQFRLSQTFGYAVAGGAAYGPTRLGTVTYAPAAATVPDTGSTVALLGLSLASVFGVARLARRPMSKA